MCTIIVLNQVHPEYPVVIAANRDEFYARPSLGPTVLSTQPRIVGGRDEERGGTWMGVTSDGLFVGLTNQRSYAPRTRAPRSRGEVVMKALRAGTVAGVRGYLSVLTSSDYESFNLIYGDAGTLEVAYVRRDRPDVETMLLPAGVTVLSNDGLQADDFPKVDRARSLVGPVQSQPWPQLVDSLQAVLADHCVPELSPAAVPKDAPFAMDELCNLQALCVHTPVYGTRSATIIALEQKGVSHYLYAAGAPCSTDLVDESHHLCAP